MAELNVTPQMIKEYRTLIGNFVLSDSTISEMIKNDIETGKLPKEFATLATDAQKAGYNANSSNVFGFGFNADTSTGLYFERTTPQVNQNEQQAKKIASSVKENSRWYKDWGGSSLVAECKKTTKDNILYTLKGFEKISPNKNLVLTITDNSTIPVEKQKEALKHIFNVLCNLAKDKGVDTTHFEKAFKTNISQSRTETRVSSTGMPSGTYTKEVLTDSNITTINNIIVGLRNSIEVKANPNVYNQIALALTPEEQIQERTIGSLQYKHSSSLEALENQNRYDGWAGELADWMSGAWGSKNREKHVRADLEVFNKQITELEEAKKVSKEAFEKKFEEIFGIKYDAELIVNYQQVEQLYQIATSCYQLEQFFKSDLNVLLSNSTLREETKTVSIDPMTSLTQTTVLATKEQVFEREFNKLANFVGQGNLENGKQQLEEVFKASGLTETSTLQEKYTVLRQVAQNYAKALHDNTMQITGNKGYEAIAKDFDDAYKSAFGVTNDIARRVAEYNVSQQAGAGVIKSAVMIGGTIALGTITGGAGLSFFPALAITSVGAGAITATTEFSDRLSSGYVIEGFKENGIEGAIDGAKQALPDEEIIRILKSSGITTLAVATGGILGAGVEIGAQALNMSILTKSLAHIAVGTGVGAGAEYLHTGTVSIQGVIFAFVLSAVGQVIAITKVGMMDNGKVTFDKQAIQQARQDLGLADDVVLTEEVLKKAYRKMSIQTHPDKGGTAEAFVKVKTAYDLLMQYAQPATATRVKSSSSQTTTKSNPTAHAEANPNLPTVIGDKTQASIVQTIQGSFKPSKTVANSTAAIQNQPIKIEYKTGKSEICVVREEANNIVKDLYARLDRTEYPLEEFSESSIFDIYFAIRKNELALTETERNTLVDFVNKHTTEESSWFPVDMSTDDRELLYNFKILYENMCKSRTKYDLLYSVKATISNNRIAGMEKDNILSFYTDEILANLTDREMFLAQELLRDNYSERIKFDYSEIYRRDIFNLLEQLGVQNYQRTVLAAEFLYCSKEEFALKIDRLNQRPYLRENAGKIEFSTWKRLLALSDTEYNELIIPVEKRKPQGLSIDTYKGELETKINAPAVHDISDVLKIVAEKDAWNKLRCGFLGSSNFTPSKLYPFETLPETIRPSIESLIGAEEAYTRLQENGSIDISIKDFGGLNPTREEIPVIHESDIERLGAKEKAGIKIQYGVKTNWNNTRIARDIMQNFYDGNGHTLEGVDISIVKNADGIYKIKISGKGHYNYERIESLGNSSKDGDSLNAGNFGEGTRIVAVNLLARTDTPSIQYACGDWKMTFSRSSEDLMTADMMQTLEQNPQTIEGNYIEFSTKDESLVREILNAKDYYYHPQNPDFQNLDVENDFFGFKLLSKEEKGNIYVVQRYEVNGEIETPLKGMTLVIKKMPNDPEILALNDGKEFELGTGRDRTSISEFKIDELLGRYVVTLPDQELLQTIATLKDFWIFDSEGEAPKENLILNKCIKEAIKRRIGFEFQEETEADKALRAFGLKEGKYVAMPENPSKTDIEMARLMGYTPVINTLGNLGISRYGQNDAGNNLKVGGKTIVEPTIEETGKIRLINEAVDIIREGLTIEKFGQIYSSEAKAPTLIYTEGGDPNQVAEAITFGGEHKGQFVQQRYLQTAEFTEFLATKLHEITHKYGSDTSKDFSLALIKLQESIIKTLVHNPDALGKIRMIEAIYNNVDKYATTTEFDYKAFQKEIEKVLAGNFNYEQYVEGQRASSKDVLVLTSETSRASIKPIDLIEVYRPRTILDKIRDFILPNKVIRNFDTAIQYKPTQKYKFEPLNISKTVDTEVLLPTTKDLLLELQNNRKVEVSINNEGGMNPTSQENTSILPEDYVNLGITKKAKIKIKYGAKINWSEFKIARDIMQNFYDGNGHTLEGVILKVEQLPNGSYKIRIEGKGKYSYTHLESIGDSSKNGDSSNAGNFGEGTRIVAVNLLSHLDTPYVKYGCGEWEMSFGRNSDDIMTADMTQTLTQTPNPIDGNYIEFVTNNPEMVEQILASKDFFYHPQNPDFQNFAYENEFIGIKLFDKEQQGKIYVVQRYETEKPKSDLRGISIVLKKQPNDPSLIKDKSIVSSAQYQDRDRLKITNENAMAMGQQYGETIAKEDLVKLIASLESYYSFAAKDVLTHLTYEGRKNNSIEQDFIIGLIQAARNKGIWIDSSGLKLASVRQFCPDKTQIQAIAQAGYRFVPEEMSNIGIPSVEQVYKEAHLVRSIEPTVVEQKKLKLVHEAIRLFTETASEISLIPTIESNKLFIFDASKNNNPNLMAQVKNKEVEALLFDRDFFKDEDFISCVTKSIAELLKVHGELESANYSYKLTDLITSELNTLIQNPEVSSKLLVLKSIYDGLE